MTFPAYLSFKADPERTLNVIKVYEYLCTTLDFVQARSVKGWALADQAGVDRTNVSGALDSLVSRGYLVEHQRTERGVRCFTLAWARPRCEV